MLPAFCCTAQRTSTPFGKCGAVRAKKRTDEAVRGFAGSNATTLLFQLNVVNGAPRHARASLRHGTTTRKNLAAPAVAGVKVSTPPLPACGAPSLAQPAGNPDSVVAD